MKTSTIIIVSLCIVAAAGLGYYLFTGKPPLTKATDKDDILDMLPEVDRAEMRPILDQMTPQELTDTKIIIQAGLDIEQGKTTWEAVEKKYPGLQGRQEAISKKYNIFT